MADPRYQRVVIVGVGLIGGSLGLALKERNLAGTVVGVSRTSKAAANLCRLGVVDEATQDLQKGVMDADLVLVATPVANITPIVLEIAPKLSPSCLVTDAGSTKLGIVEGVSQGLATLASPPQFIGSHPLAGDHKSGPESARADLFEDAVTVVTPTATTASATTTRVTEFWESVGCRVQSASPKQHDELLAMTSHLPHVAAAALASVTPEEALPLTATGWADTTRVAAGAAELWRDILLSNRKAIADGIESLETELQAYRQALKEANAEELQKLLEQGRQRRNALGS